MLRQVQLRWSGHLGGGNRRYKDTRKKSLEQLQIKPVTGEDLAQDRRAWRRSVKTFAAIYEANWIATAKAKRSARKSQAPRFKTPNTQALPTCPSCQRTFRLVRHLQTQRKIDSTASTSAAPASDPTSTTTTTTPNTDNNFINIPPPTISNIILPPTPSSPISVTNNTCPSPTTSITTSDYLPSATSNTITAPSTSDGDSVLTCPHCNRKFTSNIGLVGHLRIYCTETGEIVPGVPTNSRDRRLQCPHYPRAFTHRMGLIGHMRIHESGIHRDVSTSCAPINTSHIPPMSSTTNTNSTTPADSESPDLSCPHCHRTCASHIGLTGHLRIHRTETGEPVPGAPIYTRRTRINCPHCPRTFTHRIGLLGHMRLQENLR
ncbi:unnamed protein product [Schistocephalus solidus]|uniref:C2H2-type domain-containing protein n=1 Tax=Schistocephalus solidus TaxID=70667 RepID=A0A183TDA8_SCHSO|nr:unnamed protein product [Schistocephalus solidus]